jgi:hypothetical protein
MEIKNEIRLPHIPVFIKIINYYLFLLKTLLIILF